MAIIFRTTNLALWGSGKGSPLTLTELDNNIWELLSRVVDLEEAPDTNGIAYFETVGRTMYVHMNDLRVLGPYTLPIATFQGRGMWEPDTSYDVLNTFTAPNGNLYYVDLAHISGDTFDPGATDGSGNQYYQLMMEAPGNSLPTGGAVGQVIQKSDTPDYSVSWGWKTPSGSGNTGKFLRQKSNTQDDTEWAAPQASEVEYTPPTGSPLGAETTVQGAIDALASGGASGALADLSDVDLTTPPDVGSVLYHNGTSWVATPVASNGDVLKFDGFDWLPVPSRDVRREANIEALTSTGTASLDPSLGDVFSLGPTGDVTINAASAPAGARITIIITTVNTTSRTLTFGTNFKSQGTLVTGTVSGATFSISFTGDGTNLVEESRTPAM